MSDTAIELLRSIDNSLKRLVSAAERNASRKASWQKKFERRLNDPCLKCVLRERCKSPCKLKFEFDESGKLDVEHNTPHRSGGAGGNHE